jgi:FtsH-binding integral membrane protein
MNWKILVLIFIIFIIVLCYYPTFPDENRFLNLWFPLLILGLACIIGSYLIIVKLSAKLTGREESELKKIFMIAVIVVIGAIVILILFQALGLTI